MNDAARKDAPENVTPTPMGSGAGGAPYSFTFDKTKNSWVCSIHGAVECTGWIPCWAGCDDGLEDDYEDDPINNAPGDFSSCRECNGHGGWTVCGECAKASPDVEW